MPWQDFSRADTTGTEQYRRGSTHPFKEPFRRDALSGIVKIHLARAFEAIESGLKALADLKRNPEMSLCLPGNDLRLTQDAETELLKFKRGIDKLLPDKARKDLGISTQNN
jgi:hypothetical protein